LCAKKQWKFVDEEGVQESIPRPAFARRYLTW